MISQLRFRLIVVTARASNTYNRRKKMLRLKCTTRAVEELGDCNRGLENRARRAVGYAERGEHGGGAGRNETNWAAWVEAEDAGSCRKLDGTWTSDNDGRGWRHRRERRCERDGTRTPTVDSVILRRRGCIAVEIVSLIGRTEEMREEEVDYLLGREEGGEVDDEQLGWA